MDKKIELKPCPFCGGEAEFKAFYNADDFDKDYVDCFSTVAISYKIRCSKCFHYQPKTYSSDIILGKNGEFSVRNDGRQKAADDWNKRIDNDK